MGRLENRTFNTQHRLVLTVTIGIIAFTFVLSLLAFIATGEVDSFLVIAVVFPASFIGYSGVFFIPRFVRLSEDGIQLQFFGPVSDKFFGWRQIKTIVFERRRPGLLNRREAFLLTFRDKRGKRLRIAPTPVSRIIFEALQSTSREKGLNIEWKES